VIVNYASGARDADQVVSEIVLAGDKAFAIQADLSSSTGITGMFDAIKLKFGTVDILVNNAGVAVFEMLDDLTEDAFHKQFNLNVLGYLLAAKAAVKHMDQGGSIINISSILSTDPYIASSVYSATKGAVDTLTVALARELGPRKIRVNSILPGHTNTPATAGNFEGEFGEKLIAEHPLADLVNLKILPRWLSFLPRRMRIG
jgi:3-oxoacyl-[acyl-carrier protein] reductase